MSDLAERVGAAFRRQAPATNIDGWKARVRDELKKQGTKVSKSTIDNWYYGDVEPSGAHLLALFDYFGAEFEAEVRDETFEDPQPGKRTLKDFADQMRALLDDMVENGDGDNIARIR